MHFIGRHFITSASRHCAAFRVFVRVGLAMLALFGPLAMIAATGPEHGLVSKRGAGLVLFVSLQRQSMT
jgi:hypothetical protein